MKRHIHFLHFRINVPQQPVVKTALSNIIVHRDEDAAANKETLEDSNIEGTYTIPLEQTSKEFLNQELGMEIDDSMTVFVILFCFTAAINYFENKPCLFHFPPLSMFYINAIHFGLQMCNQELQHLRQNLISVLGSMLSS